MIIGVDVCLAQNIMGRVEWLFKCGLVLLSEIDILHLGVGFIGFVLLLGQWLDDLFVVFEDQLGTETVVVILQPSLFLLQLRCDHEIVVGGGQIHL